MTDTTDLREPPSAAADVTARRRPSPRDGAPTAALVLGALALLAAPVVVWVVDVGPAGLLVPVVGLAAMQLATSYTASIDYSPPGDPVMRRAQVGRLLGIAALVVFFAGGLGTWALAGDQLEPIGRLLFNSEFMLRAFPDLLREGLRITLVVWIGAVVIGQLLGMVLALMAISRRRLFRGAALVYIDIFRGLPAIVTIVLVGIGIPLSGLRPFGRNPIWYAATALGLIATAYIAEIVRAGIQSVDEGQMEAARSLGMPHNLAMRLVIVPQGVRRVVPALTNEYIALLKDTSLIFVISLPATSRSFFEGRDLFRVGQNLAQQFGNYSTVVAAGLFYLALTIPLTRLTNYLDRRLREGRPDSGDDELDALTTPGAQP